MHAGADDHEVAGGQRVRVAVVQYHGGDAEGAAEAFRRLAGDAAAEDDRALELGVHLRSAATLSARRTELIASAP